MTHRVSLIVLTFNRRDEVLRTLVHTAALPECPPVIVVDNGSTDGTADAIRADFPEVELIALPSNVGAAARNYGALAASTEYIAFADDDTHWAPGSLARGVHWLDLHPNVAVLSARILVGPDRNEDPVCAEMAASPLPAHGLPGPALRGFMAGACVFRRAAFFEGGGYEPRFFIGGEEALLALDLITRGWAIVYAPALTVHHLPSPKRDSAGRKRLLLRNALWVTWMRRSWRHAARTTFELACTAARDPTARQALFEALAGLPWAVRRRQALPATIEAWCAQVEGRGEPPAWMPRDDAAT